MRRIGFALLVVACVCLMFTIGQAAHQGISELHPRTYMVFRDPSDGSIITTGYVMCYESEWDTAQAAGNNPTYAYLFTRTGSGDATYFYHDDMPQGNCLTCYHIDGATVVCCAESLQFEGKALADSSVTSWEQIKENVITRANMAAGENWAWHTEIADSNFFVPADTVSGPLATQAWVEGQGYGGAGSFNMEAAEDTIWGATGAVATGQGSSTVDIVYDDGANTVTFNLANESVTSAQVDDGSLGAEELMVSGLMTPDAGEMGSLYYDGGHYKIGWEKIEDLIEAGNDLTWATPGIGYLKKLNYTGSGGASQAQIKEWAADLFDDGSFSGLTRTQSGSGETTQIDIDATDITGVMITNGSIMPQDLDDAASGANGDIAIYQSGTDFNWRTFKEWATDYSAIGEGVEDIVGNFVAYDAAGGGGIDVVYDDGNDLMDYTVYIDYTHVEPSAIRIDALHAANTPQDGDVAVVYSTALDKFQWLSFTDLLEGGTGLTVSTGSTSSTCSLTVDFGLIDWPASVSTIQILTADIWRAEIDTLEAGRVTLDSLTVLGNRWDDGAGKLLTSAFPDSADFSSVSTVALYIDGETYQESLEDYIGAMLTGNTETDITVTYEDGDGTIDLIVDASVTRDSEWDTTTEINAAMLDDDFLLESAASISTSLHVTSVRWDNGSGKIDGEQIADDTIDKDAIDTDAVDSDALKDDNAPADEDFYRYESTGSTGHWTAASEIPAMLNSSTVQVLDSNRYAESAINPAGGDSLVLAHAGVATSSTIICGWLKRPAWWTISLGKDAPYVLSVISSSADHVTIHWTPANATKTGGDAEIWYYVLGTPP